MLVGYWKVGTGKPSLTWSDSVDEAICFGWIDGVRRSIDADAYTIRFTPRKATSIWSAVNVAKVERLRTAGLMREAGERAFSLRRADRTGVYSFERNEAAVFDPKHEKKLRAHRAAAKFWDAQPEGYRKVATHWVVSAKKEETREKRFAELLADCIAGRRIEHLIPRKGSPRA